MISEIHPPEGNAETISFPPLVSVVIVTMGRIDCLQRLLASIRRQTYKSLEIIVVDNAAEPPIALEDHEIRLIRNDSNIGSSGGRNQGSAAARGEWVFFFDDDAEIVADDFMASALQFVADKPKIGAVGFPQIEPDGALMKDQPAHRDYPCTTDRFYGYACLVRNRAHKAVGGYNQIFLYYFEENEFCLKLHCAGYAIVYLPHLRAIHHQHLFGRDWRRARWLCARNAMICTLQIYPLCLIPISLVQIMRSFVRNARHHHESPWWEAIKMAVDLMRLARPIFAGRNPVSAKVILSYKRLREEQAFPPATANCSPTPKRQRTHLPATSAVDGMVRLPQP